MIPSIVNSTQMALVKAWTIYSNYLNFRWYWHKDKDRRVFHDIEKKKRFQGCTSCLLTPSLTDKIPVTLSNICCSSHMSDIDSYLSPLRGWRKEMEHYAVLQQSRYVKKCIQYPSCWGGVLQSFLSLTNYYCLPLVKKYSHKQAKGHRRSKRVWREIKREAKMIKVKWPDFK